MTLPTPEQLDTALDNLYVDAQNGSKLYQDPPADVTLRNGDVVPNLRKRLQTVTDAADQLGAIDDAVGQAQSYALGAAQSAVEAAQSADEAALYDGPWFNSVNDLMTNALLTHANTAAGTWVRTRSGFAYVVAAAGATDHHVTTSGGLKLYIMPDTQNVYNLASWNPQPGVNHHPIFQAAYDVVPDGCRLLVPDLGFAYSCLTPVTTTSGKTLHYLTTNNQAFTTETDGLNAIPGYTNNTFAYFLSESHYSDDYPDAGGLYNFSAERLATNSATSHQWDALRYHARFHDTSQGAAWGDALPTVARHGVVMSLFADMMPNNGKGEVWAQNLYGIVRAGADGILIVQEVNTDINPAVPAVRSLWGLRHKTAVAAINKNPAAPATTAFGFANGYYVGLGGRQSDLANHVDSRFLTMPGFFEVHRDGTLVIGKPAKELYNTGFEAYANGQVYQTGLAASAPAHIFALEDASLAAQAIIGSIQARAKDSIGEATAFAQINLWATNPTTGSETGLIDLIVKVAGTDVSALRVSNVINAALPIQRNGVQVLNTRATGWAAATGTATRTSFVTGTVTTTQLAERVKALIDDLISHGLIGA